MANIEFIGYAYRSSDLNLTTVSTDFQDVTDVNIEFTAVSGAVYRVITSFNCQYNTNTDWHRHYMRISIGSGGNCLPSYETVRRRDSPSLSVAEAASAMFILTDIPAGATTIQLQSSSGGAGSYAHRRRLSKIIMTLERIA